MSTTGLDVFDRTLQTTHIWLDQIMEELGPDRRVAGMSSAPRCGFCVTA